MVFDKRVPHIHERIRADVAQRLGLLYVDMKDGRIEQTLQGQLQALAEAIEAHDSPEIRRLTTTMVSQHWQQHKAWLKGIKSLSADKCASIGGGRNVGSTEATPTFAELAGPTSVQPQLAAAGAS